MEADVDVGGVEGVRLGVQDGVGLGGGGGVVDPLAPPPPHPPRMSESADTPAKVLRLRIDILPSVAKRRPWLRNPSPSGMMMF
jgi:hypothetical protein